MTMFSICLIASDFYSILPWIRVFIVSLPWKNNHGRKRETRRWICTNNSWSEIYLMSSIKLASSDNIRKSTKTVYDKDHLRHLICNNITWASLSIFDIGLWFFINLCRLRSSEIQKHSILRVIILEMYISFSWLIFNSNHSFYSSYTKLDKI